jgi:hypothetical protein
MRLIMAFILLVSAVTFLSAAELTEREKQLRECIPLLATLMATENRESKIPDSPMQFATFMLNEMRLFENPIFLRASLEQIKPGRIKEMVNGKFKHDDISPDLATHIWGSFLKYFDPNETDQTKLQDTWSKLNAQLNEKRLGAIDFQGYKVWQDLAKEFVFEPHKTDSAIALIRNMMPSYLAYLDAWFDRYEAQKENTGTMSKLMNLGKNGKLDDRVKETEKYLTKQSPTDFQMFMGEKDLLPTTLKQFQDAMARIVDIEKLKALQPQPDLTDSRSATIYGNFFNPLILAISDSLMTVQQSHLRNVSMSGLKEQYPEGKLPARIEHIDLKGLLSDIETERRKVLETHTKIEYLLQIEEGVEKSLLAHLTAASEARKKPFVNERTEHAFLSRMQSLEGIRSTMVQVIATTQLVLDNLSADHIYLDTLSLALSQAHMSEAMETEQTVDKSSALKPNGNEKKEEIKKKENPK